MFKSYWIDRKKKFNAKKVLKKFEINNEEGADEIRKMSALIRFHFKINPDDLSDSDFSRTWNDLRYCLDFENKRNALDMP